MAFKGLKKIAEERRNEFLSHVKPEIQDRFKSGKTIELHEYMEMRMNSYEFRLLQPLWSDEVLLHIINNSLDQEGNTKLYETQLPRSYTESVLRLHIWDLLERFEKLKINSEIL